MNARISILDIDKASGDFVDFLDDIKRITSGHDNGNNTDEGGQSVVSNILTPMMQMGLGIRDTAELASIHESLMQIWIVPLSRRIPDRVRIASERLFRDLAGQIGLASHAMHIDSRRTGEEDENQSESLDSGVPFELPVRRRISATNLGKGKERADVVSSAPPASSQMSEDAGIMPPPAVAPLPTPEPTPSLRSRSSVSSLVPGSVDPMIERLRGYANLTPIPALPAKLSNMLGHWQIRVDPAESDWQATQQAAATEDESENESQTRLRRRAEKQRKRQREDSVGPSSQPMRNPLGGSQPHQGQDTRDRHSSSQQTEKAVTMSQVEPGKFGGRQSTGKKLKVKARPAGVK